MKGFTLVELLVIIGISAMLAVMAITYTSMSRNEIALSVETAKVAEMILRAKNLAIATYNLSPGTCGYGVSVNIQKDMYSIFAYTPSPAKYGPVPPCPSVASTTAGGISSSTEMAQYSGAAWNVPLANGVNFISGGRGDDLTVVLFYPPTPATIMSRDGGNFFPLGSASTSRIYLLTADGHASSVIAVNPAGQVAF